ncbi:MAG: flagellar export protein FliJ [Candidatus Latescibacteria bacterium]|nr:flagellar export protein FliJ [Candidatus Latescibacterota bacterium]
MKQFSFRLQKVMDLRKQKERLRQQELAASTRQEKTQRAEVTRREESRLQYGEKIVADSHSGGDLSKTRLYRAYQDRLSKEIVEEGLTLQKLEKKTRRSRDILLEASRERKTLESLKERSFTEYQKMERREDQILTDETAARVFLRPNPLLATTRAQP